MLILYAFPIMMLQKRHSETLDQEVGAHGSYDGSCLTEKITCTLESHYHACGAASSSSTSHPILYMVNHNAWEVVAASGRHQDPAELFRGLHAFSGNALLNLGEGHPFFDYPNFYAGNFSRSVDGLVGAGDAYSAVHQVSKCFAQCPLFFLL